MTERKGDKPAFPAHCPDHRDLYSYIDRGMAGITVRQYYAAKAMQGILAGRPAPGCGYVARTAFEIADEMLKAEEK